MTQYSISKDKLRWIRHSVMYDVDTREPYPHPSKVWESRGVEHIVKAVPETIADCWMILVKDWDGELAKYEKEIMLEPNEDYWAYFKIEIVE